MKSYKLKTKLNSFKKSVFSASKKQAELLRRRNAFFFIVLVVLALSGIFWVAHNQISDLELISSQKPLINFTDESLFRPLKKNGFKNLNLETTAGLSIFINTNKQEEKILYAKNIDQISSLASLTKLMTALVAIEEYGLDKKIVISPNEAAAITAFGGNPRALNKATTKDLLYIMLIESNNSAADVLANQLSKGEFMALMNKKAAELGLTSTIYYNPSGLDEDDLPANQSSARDLGKLIVYILKNQPLISEICSLSEVDYYVGNYFYKKLENTNVLLREHKEYLWGKTGYTKTANGCIILVLKRPLSFPLDSQNEYLINVILGADGKDGRFVEAQKLESWLTDSFIW